MKKFVIVFLLILSSFMVGCIGKMIPEIKVDEIIEVHTDEVYTILGIEGIDEKYELTYKSMDEAIFKIKDSNIIVPVSVGTADLVITIEDFNIDVIVKVIIKERIEEEEKEEVIIEDLELMFFNSNFNILVTEDLQMNLFANLERVTENITWKSSDEEVATVNSSGIVTGKKYGRTTISATYKERTIQTDIKVSSTKEVTGNTITVSGIKFVEVGESITLKVSNVTISGGSYNFSSSNEDIATISDAGVIKGISAGTITITVQIVEVPSVSFSFDVNILTPKVEG